MSGEKNSQHQVDEVSLGEEPGVLVVGVMDHHHQRRMGTLRRVPLVLCPKGDCESGHCLVVQPVLQDQRSFKSALERQQVRVRSVLHVVLDRAERSWLVLVHGPDALHDGGSWYCYLTDVEEVRGTLEFRGVVVGVRHNDPYGHRDTQVIVVPGVPRRADDVGGD